jgi:Glycosyl hydrolase family 26
MPSRMFVDYRRHPINNRGKQMMDNVSQYLLYMRDAGVDVMFRPLPEMNHNCFWWSGRRGPNGSRRLYQITHDNLILDVERPSQAGPGLKLLSSFSSGLGELLERIIQILVRPVACC